MEQEQEKSAARGKVLLLPPDPACSITNQMRAGQKLGAAVLIIIAGATDQNIAAAASSATTSLFTDDFLSSEPPSTIGVESRVDILSGPREDRPPSERAGQSGKITGGRRARGEAGGDVLGSVAGDASGASAVPEEPPGDACPPLTVVIGHEEGKRVLEWLSGMRSAAMGKSCLLYTSPSPRD